MFNRDEFLGSFALGSELNPNPLSPMGLPLVAISREHDSNQQPPPLTVASFLKGCEVKGQMTS